MSIILGAHFIFLILPNSFSICPMAKSNVLSFVLADIHPHDIGTFLDSDGISVRTGHHCAQPLMKRLSVSATARASLSFYNTREEIDKLKDSLLKIKKFFN